MLRGLVMAGLNSLSRREGTALYIPLSSVISFWSELFSWYEREPSS